MTHVRILTLLLTAAALLFVVSGCAATRITKTQQVKLGPTQELMPVLPFVSILVPEGFGDGVFNNFVDILNDNRSKTGIKWFSIIKDDMKIVERQIPPDNIYLAGEIWSYIENAGCCSTELRVKARIRFYEVSNAVPIMEIMLPLEGFFEHDRSTLSVEREKLAIRLSQEMAAQVLNVLKTASPHLPTK
jgi:hypothetical protein